MSADGRRRYLFCRRFRRGYADWILAFGYDNNDLESRRHPTAAELDEISVSNPILLTHASGHMGVFNSAALRAIGAENPQDIEGGMIGRTSSGAPDGYMEEKAFFYYSRQTRKQGKKRRRPLDEGSAKIVRFLRDRDGAGRSGQ